MQRDPVKTYNKRSVRELTELAPAIDWRGLLGGLYQKVERPAGAIESVNISDPELKLQVFSIEYITKLNQIISEYQADPGKLKCSISIVHC